MPEIQVPTALLCSQLMELFFCLSQESASPVHRGQARPELQVLQPTCLRCVVLLDWALQPMALCCRRLWGLRWGLCSVCSSDVRQASSHGSVVPGAASSQHGFQTRGNDSKYHVAGWCLRSGGRGLCEEWVELSTCQQKGHPGGQVTGLRSPYKLWATPQRLGSGRL